MYDAQGPHLPSLPSLPIHQLTRTAAARASLPSPLLLLQPEVLHTAGGGGIVHVPFLRSGMFAAHQGYSLDSELSRKSLQSRLPLPVLPGGDENPLSARTTSALKGLQELMESTRTLGLSEEEASLLETLLPGAMPAMELAEGVGGDASEGTTAEAGPQPAAGPPAPAHALDEDVLAELADWEARQAELAHHQQLKSQTGTSHERRAAARLLLPPVPAAPKADLLEALTAVQGVETSRIVRLRCAFHLAPLFRFPLCLK